jgi:hypothetical protein
MTPLKQITERDWWARAERECPAEYSDLVSALSHRNPDAAYARRAMAVARKKLIEAMVCRGFAAPMYRGE